MTVIYKALANDPELGEMVLLPDGSIINAGGVEGPYFTVGGQAVILKDGTASDGSGPVIVVEEPGTIVVGVTGIEHIQDVESDLWIIDHSKNTKRIQVTIWDDDDEQILPDAIKLVDLNSTHIKFNTAITGRAILMMF